MNLFNMLSLIIMYLFAFAKIRCRCFWFYFEVLVSFGCSTFILVFLFTEIKRIYSSYLTYSRMSQVVFLNFLANIKDLFFPGSLKFSIKNLNFSTSGLLILSCLTPLFVFCLLMRSEWRTFNELYHAFIFQEIIRKWCQNLSSSFLISPHSYFP